MHRDARPPHWKSIQMQKFQKSRGSLDGQNYGCKDGCNKERTYRLIDRRMYE